MKRSLLTAIFLLAACTEPSAERVIERPLAVSVAPAAATAAHTRSATRSAANRITPRQSAARPDREQLADGLARAARRDPGASIVGGEPHTGNPEVALIIASGAGPDEGLICTGTLIAPKLILTAAHCVDEFDFPVERFDVYFGTDATVKDDPGFVFATPAESAVFHPGWDRDAIVNDIAVMHLVDEVPITPAPINTTPLSDADVGAELHLVGWGITAGAARDSGIKRHVFSQVESIEPDLVQVGNAETNICSGDSGGPAFLDKGGVEHVAGVASFGDVDCAIEGFSTRVDVFMDFITANSEPGGGNPGGGGFGDPCVEGAECESGVCVTSDDGKGGICTELCDETTACPDGSECVQVDDENAVCLPPEQGGGGQLGDACTADADCASQLCAVTPEGDGVCTEECTGVFDCEAGFSCTDIEGGSVCLPAAEDPGEGGFPTPIPSEDEGGCSAAENPGGLMALLLALAALILVRPAQPRSPLCPAPRSPPE